MCLSVYVCVCVDQSDSFFHEKHPRSGAIHPDSFSLKFYLFLSDTVPALSADVLEYPQASPASSNDICDIMKMKTALIPGKNTASAFITVTAAGLRWNARQRRGA